MNKEELIKIGKESYKQGGIDAIESVLETMETAKLTAINKDQLGIVLAKYKNMSLESHECAGVLCIHPDHGNAK